MQLARKQGQWEIGLENQLKVPPSCSGNEPIKIPWLWLLQPGRLGKTAAGPDVWKTPFQVGCASGSPDSALPSAHWRLAQFTRRRICFLFPWRVRSLKHFPPGLHLRSETSQKSFSSMNFCFSHLQENTGPFDSWDSFLFFIHLLFQHKDLLSPP